MRRHRTKELEAFDPQKDVLEDFGDRILAEGRDNMLLEHDIELVEAKEPEILEAVKTSMEQPDEIGRELAEIVRKKGPKRVKTIGRAMKKASLLTPEDHWDLKRRIDDIVREDG